ncbi:class I SAM-dependent methyltransferase [Flexivirga meconopsidis]|uniref:class I SAM-dependent methyltransferase n=1 Tax=Flexivirga meconopsidis TaxID=2977121 RepID=UPI00224003A6|nr:class I SAM-dependent methyltransferase [Flexivirga meconopsidis]
MSQIALNNPDPDVLDGRHIRAAAFEGAQRELLDLLPLPASATDATPRALTVGAGYSWLPHLIASAGYQVSAIDSSAEATAVASSNTAEVAADIDFRVGEVTSLPAPDASFDLVWCIDTLETTDDPHGVLAELARVRRPSGALVLDTVSDTWLSRLIYLRLFQQVPGTRIMPPGRYTTDRLRTPAFLAEAVGRINLEIAEIHGYEPASPQTLLSALLRRRRGKLTDAELAEAAGFTLSEPGHEPPVTYFAIARPA